jgi:hypothetical protein
MTANELLLETHPGRTILEDVVKPLGIQCQCARQRAPHPRDTSK